MPISMAMPSVGGRALDGHTFGRGKPVVGKQIEVWRHGPQEVIGPAARLSGGIPCRDGRRNRLDNHLSMARAQPFLSGDARLDGSD